MMITKTEDQNRPLSLGSYRALQQLSVNGLFRIVAIDHRGVFVELLKKAGKPFDLNNVRTEKFKIIRSLNRHVSGFLVDPIYSLPMGIYNGAIPGSLGFMVSLESDDYSTENFSDKYFIEGLSARKIKDMGASAVKLFFYYDPYSKNAEAQDRVIEELFNDCQAACIPLLLEPILQSDKTGGNEEKTEMVFEMLTRLSKIAGNLFKIEFPGDLEHYTYEQNLSICNEVSKILPVPWVIMSSGIGMAEFSQQLQISCRGGASGFVVGRALWGDFVLCEGTRETATEELTERLIRLNMIAENHARKWSDILAPATFDQSTMYL